MIPTGRIRKAHHHLRFVLVTLYGYRVLAFLHVVTHSFGGITLIFLEQEMRSRFVSGVSGEGLALDHKEIL